MNLGPDVVKLAAESDVSIPHAADILEESKGSPPNGIGRI